MIRARSISDLLELYVAGPATMTESPAVDESARAALARGARSLRIDLRDCTTMDSTFSGTLLSLRRRLEMAGGRLTLVSPAPRVLELLREMGLEDFYDVEVSERTDVSTWQDITPPSRPSIEKLRRLVLEAHDELAHAPGAADGFRAVIEELRRDGADGDHGSGVNA